jgi:predicted transcriptional regulator
MPIVSIRLPDEVDRGLNREAQRTQRPKSEIARDAIADYLNRQQRDRFLADIAKAARSRGDTEALEYAAEALPFDNEALTLTEGASIREPRAKYKSRQKRR